LFSGHFPASYQWSTKMAHSYRKDGPGGLPHVVLGVGIIMAIGLFTNFPDMFKDVVGHKSAPRMVMTEGAKSNDCAAQTVETIIGTIGCGGTKRAAHLQRVTLVSADKTH
jgi:hypothetical protein